MTNFQLNVEFSSEDLVEIYKNNEQVVLFKLVDGGGAPVAWTTLKPFEQNIFQWDDAYFVYSSTTEIRSGVIITIEDFCAVLPQQSCDFLPDGTFSTPVHDPSVEPDAYQITNQFPQQTFTFGLAQAVQPNGPGFNYHPICAQMVLENDTVVFTPLTQVAIFLSNKISTGMIINEPISLVTILTFDPGIYSITVRYDSTSGTFIQTQATS